MIAFVTSLRHPLNSDSYATVEALLRQTLDSVCAQDDDDFVVVVVGNQVPAEPLPDRVHFVLVDFPPPTTTPGPRTELGAFVRDKGTKIGIGLLYARQFDPHHVMIFDADDFVSRRIAGFVNASSDSPGWVLSDGWMYSARRGVFRRISDFNRTCGTCFVLPYSAYDVPAGMDVDATQEELIEGFDERLPRILGAHRDAVQWHADRGRMLEKLPFRGAVYHVDTGENHSGKTMEGLAHPSTRSLRREFGVPRQTTLVVSVWRSLAWRGRQGIPALLATRGARALGISRPRPSRS